MMEHLIDKLYEEFKGLPNIKPIVRNNIREDAYTLTALKILYGKEFKLEFVSSNIDRICEFVVAPPDGGIDIFVEHEDGDEFNYDVIQVKYSELDENTIKQCFSVMERTISDYCKAPKLVEENLRKIISNTNFDNTYKKKCTYYVIHKGSTKFIKSLNKNEAVITFDDLNILRDSIIIDKVPFEKFRSDSFNNFIMYEQKQGEQALLCNLRGYDLASLSNKYINTSVGKNILYGQNLRESLGTKSKTYKYMKDTIDFEPDRFWYYNNGITIITEDLDTKTITDGDNSKIDSFELRNFSIINGAQTTSSLGTYLKEAIMDKEYNKIDQLKKVFVLARILEVNNQDFSDKIAIYNNTQNPITSRDMVSNRKEQKKLFNWLCEGEKPHIFVEIRRGDIKPNHPHFYKHQCTTNEELAQLAFAAFLRSPFTAKDKKKSLFNNDYTKDEFIINEDYHKIFYYPEEINEESGILFKKEKHDIDEVLFVQHLYKESKKYLNKIYDDRINKAIEKCETEEDKAVYENEIITHRVLKEICNVSMFYCIALYFQFKNRFSDFDKGKYFLVDRYYSQDVEFRENMIKSFANTFLIKTIEIIKKEAEQTSNVNNWIRLPKSQEAFYKNLNDALALHITYEEEFRTFISNYKTNI